MYWKEQPKQLALERKRVCGYCHRLDPPTEPAYGCPECGEGAIQSQLPEGSEPEGKCPWCGEGVLEKVTEDACSLCGQGEVGETEVQTCDYCGGASPRGVFHYCPKRPREEAPARPSKPAWTEGEGGKRALFQLECRAQEERVNTGWMRRPCPGWQRAVERYHDGDKGAFRECLECALQWPSSPGQLTTLQVEPYTHQLRMGSPTLGKGSLEEFLELQKRAK